MSVLGLDVDEKIANVAILKNKKDIIFFKTLKLSEVNNLKKNCVISGLCVKDILIKTKEIVAKKDLKRIIMFQKENFCSIKKEDSVVSTIFVKDFKNTKELFFYITTKEKVKNHILSLEKFDIFPDFISCDANALARFAGLYFHQKKELFILHVKRSGVILVMTESGFAKKSHFMNFQNFEKELKRAFFSFLPKNKKLSLLITGQSTKELKDKILSASKNFITKVLDIKKDHLLPFAISIGFALEGILKDNKSIDFRQKNFILKKHKRKIFTYLIFVSLFSFFFMGAILFQGQKVINKRKEFLQKKIFALQKAEKIENRKNISLEKELDFIEKKITKEKKLFFLLFPKKKKVSFLLDFIENIKSKNIDILNFKYDFFSFPTYKNRKKPYGLKIRILFYSLDGREAKEFYEKIIFSKLVDLNRKKEMIKEKNNKYRISFFLRSRIL